MRRVVIITVGLCVFASLGWHVMRYEYGCLYHVADSNHWYSVELSIAPIWSAPEPLTVDEFRRSWPGYLPPGGTTYVSGVYWPSIIGAWMMNVLLILAAINVVCALTNRLPPRRITPLIHRVGLYCVLAIMALTAVRIALSDSDPPTLLVLAVLAINAVLLADRLRKPAAASPPREFALLSDRTDVELA
jgi:hypothetical protein